ncbi:MAG: AbrB family transcriptional regulator [Marinibacterium sp.]|nr:AbrB family transcriptional regulator [Marinibacterium sp.]
MQIRPLAPLVQTLAIAALGAGLAALLHMPAALLTGPALAVSLAALAGCDMQVPDRLRDLVFVVLGVGIGSTVTDRTTDAILRWPLAFLALVPMLALTMVLGQWALRRGFGFDRRSAVLAAAPGHLSFVIGLGLDMGVDVMRVTVAQSLRLLMLTLLVPVLALLMGVGIPANALAGSQVMGWGAFAGLIGLSALVGLGLQRLRMPAALLVGAMIVSGVAHGAGWVSGGLHPGLGAAGFVMLGALIGTRFSGVRPAVLAQAAGAGVVTTAIAGAMTVLFALPLAWAMGLPEATVMTAFAPGGFETMVALGAVLGSQPGFVAACHVMRLLILSALIPAMLRLSPS